MIEQLFGSKTRVKLLHLFYANPNRSFYVREITRKIDEQINSVRRELANLLSIGIISSENTNNKLYYEVNQTYEYYKPMRQIFAHIEASDDVKIDNQEKRFRDIGSVKAAYLMGKFVREAHQPVDLVIVGDVNKKKLDKLVMELEEEQGEEINFAVLSEADYKYRQRIGDRFAVSVNEAKKTAIIDELHEQKAEKTKVEKKKEKK